MIAPREAGPRTGTLIQVIFYSWGSLELEISLQRPQIPSESLAPDSAKPPYGQLLVIKASIPMSITGASRMDIQ
jgi:hypothetical protein